MSRAIPTISLLLAALAGFALVRGCRGDITVPVDEPPPIAIEPAGPPTAATPDPVPPLANDAPTADLPQVWLELRTIARFEASRAPTIAVLRLGKPVAAQAEIVAGDPDADPAGADRRWPRLVRVQIGGSVWHRQAIPHDGVLLVELGPDRTLRGRVVDRAAVPVADAVVFTGGAVDETVTTDTDGRFEARVPAGPGIPVVVRAADKAWRAAIVDVARDFDGVADFALADEMPLEVHALGPQAPIAGATAAVLPADEPDTDLQAWPPFALDLFGPVPVDERGTAKVRGLPRGAVVRALLFGPGLACTSSEAVALRRAARADVPVRELPMVGGHVVDERGAPVVGADVAWCEAGERPWAAARAPGLLPSWWPAAGVVLGQSGEDGSFTMARPALGKPRLRASRPGGPTVELQEPVDAGSVRLVLPREVPARATLVVARPDATAWALRVTIDAVDVRLPPPGADAEVTLDGAGGVYALRVRVGRADAWSEPRELPQFVIAGRTTVPAALLQH